MLPLEPFGNPIEVIGNRKVDFGKLNANLRIYEGRCFDLELAKQINFITQDLKPLSYRREVKKFIEDCTQIEACPKVNSLTVWTIVNSSELVWYPLYRWLSQKWAPTFTFDRFISFVNRFISAVFVLYELEILTDDPYLPQSYAKIFTSGIRLSTFMPANVKDCGAFWNNEEFISSKFYTPLLSFFSRRLPGGRWKGDKSGYDNRVNENMMVSWAANGGIRYEHILTCEPQLLRTFCRFGKKGFGLYLKAYPYAMSTLKNFILKILETKGEVPRMLPALGIISNHSAKIARVIDCLFIKAYPKRNQLSNGKYCTCLWEKCSCEGFDCRCPMKKLNGKKATPRSSTVKTYYKDRKNWTTKGNFKKTTNTVRHYSAISKPQSEGFQKILTEDEWVQRYSRPAIIRPLSDSSDDDTSIAADSQRTSSDARLDDGEILRAHSVDDNKYVFNIDRAHLDMRNITLNCDQHRNYPTDREGPTRGEEDDSDPDKNEVQNTSYNDREVYDVDCNGYGNGYGCGNNPNKDDPSHGNPGLRNYGNGCHDHDSNNDFSHGNQVKHGYYPYDDGFTYDEYYSQKYPINAEDDEHGAEDQNEFAQQGNTHDYDVDVTHNDYTYYDSHGQDEFGDHDEDYNDNHNDHHTHDSTTTDNSIDSDDHDCRQDDEGHNVEDDQDHFNNHNGRYTSDSTDNDNSINSDCKQDEEGTNVEDDQEPQNQDSYNNNHHDNDSYNNGPYEENNGDCDHDSDHDSYNSSDY